jgi:LETM1 and EF-hand domain-containing protein 1
LPQRNYATETNTHGSDSGPPPGFNIDEAKKPLPKGADKEASPTPTVAELKASDEQLKTPKGEATMIDKTKALEKASLSELAAKKAAEPAQSTSTSVGKKKEEFKKLTIGQKIKKEIMHYWDGTKLLAAEVRISSKLALKMAAGYELSRRENRQVSAIAEMAQVSLLTNLTASENRSGSGPLGSLLGFRHRPLRRTVATSCSQALP